MILLVLAAGKGSRYGGPKQIDSLFDVNGVEKTLLHFSLENSIPFFEKYVFVITKEIKSSFEILFYDFMKSHDSEIVIQDFPLGTAYPIICARDKLDNDFVVINADDYYGKESFKNLFDNKFFTTCMIGYKLSNTLSQYGKANRGFCKLDSNNNLLQIEENTGIIYEEYKNDDKTIVSMNLFGFQKEDLKHFCFQYKLYVSKYTNEEFMLPKVVDFIIKYKKIKVILTDDIWVGLTYKEDKQRVIDFIKKNH